MCKNQKGTNYWIFRCTKNKGIEDKSNEFDVNKVYEIRQD